MRIELKPEESINALLKDAQLIETIKNMLVHDQIMADARKVTKSLKEYLYPEIKQWQL